MSRFRIFRACHKHSQLYECLFVVRYSKLIRGALLRLRTTPNLRSHFSHAKRPTFSCPHRICTASNGGLLSVRSARIPLDTLSFRGGISPIDGSATGRNAIELDQLNREATPHRRSSDSPGDPTRRRRSLIPEMAWRPSGRRMTQSVSAKPSNIAC
jgi:hypothetical protein